MRNPELEAAYLATEYSVKDTPNGPFVIRIGEFCIELEELLFDEFAFDWAYLTACNPESVFLGGEENALRTIQLRELLVAIGKRPFYGVASSRDGSWREPSFLVLDMTMEEGLAIASRFGQNAFVAGVAAEPAKLVWT